MILLRNPRVARLPPVVGGPDRLAHITPIMRRRLTRRDPDPVTRRIPPARRSSNGLAICLFTLCRVQDTDFGQNTTWHFVPAKRSEGSNGHTKRCKLAFK
ncbi:unnamed protein product, partial [Iphiclides podalirius]